MKQFSEFMYFVERFCVTIHNGVGWIWLSAIFVRVEHKTLILIFFFFGVFVKKTKKYIPASSFAFFIGTLMATWLGNNGTQRHSLVLKFSIEDDSKRIKKKGSFCNNILAFSLMPL